MPTMTKARAYQLRTVFKAYNHCCAACGSPLDIEHDHVQPRCAGGSDELDNIQVLCHHCNNAKNGTPNLPKLEPREPEWDVRQIMANREGFREWLRECRERG